MEKFPLAHRSPEQRSNPESEYGPKTSEQKHRLRKTLLALGVGVAVLSLESDKHTQKDSTEEPVTPTSEADTDATNLPENVYAVDDTLYTTRPPAVIPDRLQSVVTEATPVVPEDSESIETHESSSAPHFEAYTQAAAAAYTMRRDQVVLTDTNGEMLSAGAIDLHDAAGYTPSEMTWRHQGGPPVGIPGLLLKELRATVSAETGVPENEINVRHEYLGMLKSEFEDVASLQESALHNANQEVPDDPQGRSFLEVIADEFEAPIPGPDGVILSAMLKEYLPALISKESLFSVTAVSSEGARGALQFIPDTWKKYAPEGTDPKAFVPAVKAAGAYFAASYEYLYNHSLNELDVIESEFFPGNHEAFVSEFVFFCLLNGYNAGDGTMRKALEHFAREHGTQADLQAYYNTTEPVGGKDVFFAFTRIESQNEQVPLYGQYASAYSLEIAARKAAGTTLPQSQDKIAQLNQ